MAFLDLELKLCGQHIECFRQFVFLGITIHETLNWDRYIDKIANKISRTLGVMNKLKHFLPKYTLKIMYSSLIAPHYNNNILLWGFNTHRLINTLTAKDGDLRLSAPNACLPKTEISVFVTECVFFTSTCYELHMFILLDALYS